MAHRDDSRSIESGGEKGAPNEGYANQRSWQRWQDRQIASGTGKRIEGQPYSLSCAATLRSSAFCFTFDLELIDGYSPNE